MLSNSFIDRVRRQRAVASASVQVSRIEGLAVSPVLAEDATAALSAPIPPGGKAAGRLPGPGEVTLAGQAATRRRTFGEAMAVARGAGIPEWLFVRHPSAIALSLAAITRAVEVLEKAVRVEPEDGARVEARAGADAKAGAGVAARAALLPGDLLEAAEPALAAMDAETGAQALTKVFRAIRGLAGRAPDADRMLALETGVRVLATFGPKAFQERVEGVAQALIAASDPSAARAAVLGVERFGPKIRESGFIGEREAVLDAALAAALAGAADPAGPVEDILSAIGDQIAGLTAGQRAIIAELIPVVRDIVAFDRAAAQQAAARLAELRAGHEAAGPHDPGLEASRARAERELSPGGLAAWLEAVAALRAKGVPADAQAVVAELLLARLRALPPPDEASPAVVELAGRLGVLATALGPEAVAALDRPAVLRARPEVLERAIEVLRSVAPADRSLPAARVGDLTAALVGCELAPFADLARRDALAQLVCGAAGTPAEAEAALHGPRLVASAYAMEAGPARSRVLERLGADLLALARLGAPLAPIWAAHPTVPEACAPRFAAIAEARGLSLDAWMAQLGRAFAGVRANRDAVRALRTLLILADETGEDAPRLLTGLQRANPAPRALMRQVRALLGPGGLTAKEIRSAIEALEGDRDLAAEVEARSRAALKQDRALKAFLGDAPVQATQRGHDLVEGELRRFFLGGIENRNLDRTLFRGLLVAVLEDRFDGFRFETPAAQRQLACLTPEQQKKWRSGATMAHIRFRDDGQARFDDRVRAAAKFGGELVEWMARWWGPLDALERCRDAARAQLRAVDKQKTRLRRVLGADVRATSQAVRAMNWAKAVAALTPETITPVRFAALADEARALRPALGSAGPRLIQAFVEATSLADVAYSEVTTADAPGLAEIYNAVDVGTGCLAYWPRKTDLLAYCVDANKRMIITRDQHGSIRRAVMRLVEEEGPPGRPLLLLERSYPDEASKEQKQRLIEHVLRRAVDLGIGACFATEYYWKPSETGRRYIADLDALLADLNRRYGTAHAVKDLKLKNVAGNMPREYLDSAPRSRAMRGQVGERYYAGDQDTVFENEFVLMAPSPAAPAREG